MLRAPGQFEKRTENPTDNYERLYLTHEDVENGETKSRFVIKHPQNSHMSTVAMLERSYRLEYHNQYGPADLPAIGDVSAIINQPGFAMQNIIAQFTTNFGATTHIDQPCKWLPWYSRLYSKSLMSCVRKSGRNFANYYAGEYNEYYDTTIERKINLREVELEHFQQQGRIELPDRLIGNEGWDYHTGAQGISVNDARDLIIQWRPDLDTAGQLAFFQAFNTMQGTLTGANKAQRRNNLIALTEEYAALALRPAPTADETARLGVLAPIMAALQVLEAAVHTSTPNLCLAALVFWQGEITPDNADVLISDAASFQDADTTKLTPAQANALIKKCHFINQVHQPATNIPAFASGRNIFQTYWNDNHAANQRIYAQDTAQLAIVSADNVSTAQRQTALFTGMMTGRLPRACLKVLNDCGLNNEPPDPAKADVRNAVFDAGTNARVYTDLDAFYTFCTDMETAYEAVNVKDLELATEIVVHDHVAEWITRHQNHYVVSLESRSLLVPTNQN